MVKITVTVGRGDGASEREINIDPEDFPLQFYLDMEATKESGANWMALIHAYAPAVGFTPEEMLQVSMRDWKRILSAVNGVVVAESTIPNGVS